MGAITAYTATVKSVNQPQFPSETLFSEVFDDVLTEAVPGVETGDGRTQSSFGQWKSEYYV